MALRTVGVKLMAEVSGYTSGIEKAQQSTKGFVGDLAKASKAGKLDAVADQATKLGLGLAGVAGYAIKAAADFDKSMSAVSAATHASTKDIDALRAAALRAGKDTQYSATEAANGITELSKAGVGTADILNGGLKGALSLAAAGQLSVADAAETAATALTQFKLKGSAVPHVADLLAAAAGKAQGSVADVGMALKQSGLVAAQFGMSIEDTTGVLAEFANAGLIGSDAGTSLKTMLLALNPTSKQTKDLMNQLGISFSDSQGKFIGMAGVAQVLQDRLKGLTDAQRQQALGQIFGNDAIRGASILYTDGADGVAKWKKAVDDAGYAGKTAAELTNNLAGDIERLKGSLETLAIEGGSGPNSGLRFLVKVLDHMVSGFLSLPAPITTTVTVLTGLTGVTLLAAVGWSKLGAASAKAKAELIAVGPAGETVAKGLGKVGSITGKVAGAFLALQAAGAVINTFQTDLNPQVEALAISLTDFAASGKVSGEAARVLGDNLDDLKVGFAFLADGDNSRRAAVRHIQGGLESIVPGLDGTSTSLTKTRERVDALDQALAGMVQGGQTQQAAANFTALAQQLAVGGVSLDEVKKQFPQYAAALQVADNATTTTTGAVGDLNSALQTGADAQDKYATVTEAAAGAARGERAALVALSSQLKAQTDPVFGLLDAEQGLAAAQKDVAKATKEHGKNSDETREANRKLALAAIDLQGAVGTLGSTFNGKLDPALAATLRAAGLTKGEIANVAKQFQAAKDDGDAFAKTYQAQAGVTGVVKAKQDLASLQKQINQMHGKSIPITVRVTKKGETIYGNQAPQMAAGGPVTGPGPKGVDSQPRILAPGEHVWTAPEVDAVGGQGAMVRMRAAALGGSMRGMAAGGPVTSQMTPYAQASAAPSVVELRLSFDESQGEMGRLFVKALRTSPGLASTTKKLILKAAG